MLGLLAYQQQNTKTASMQSTTEQTTTPAQECTCEENYMTMFWEEGFVPCKKCRDSSKYMETSPSNPKRRKCHETERNLNIPVDIHGMFEDIFDYEDTEYNDALTEARVAPPAGNEESDNRDMESHEHEISHQSDEESVYDSEEEEECEKTHEESDRNGVCYDSEDEEECEKTHIESDRNHVCQHSEDEEQCEETDEESDRNDDESDRNNDESDTNDEVNNTDSESESDEEQVVPIGSDYNCVEESWMHSPCYQRGQSPNNDCKSCHMEDRFQTRFSSRRRRGGISGEGALEYYEQISQFSIGSGKLKITNTYKFPRIMPTEINEIVEFWEMDFQVGNYIIPRMGSWHDKSLVPNENKKPTDFRKYCAYKDLYTKWTKCNHSLDQWYSKYGYMSLQSVLTFDTKGQKRKYITQRPGSASTRSPREKRKCLTDSNIEVSY